MAALARSRAKTNFTRQCNWLRLFKPSRENISLFQKRESTVSCARPASDRTGASRSSRTLEAPQPASPVHSVTHVFGPDKKDLAVEEVCCEPVCAFSNLISL